MKRLSKEQVFLLHHALILETGGLDGIREDGLLESSLEAPFQSFEGTEVYPSIWQKGARLGFGLIQNHPFIDGNKRIGAHAMLVFLSLNGIDLQYTQQELSDMILAVAAGELPFEGMVKWVIAHQI